jgi:four helix bundle protein
MFEKLEVYQKAVDLADKLTKITSEFPKGTYYLSDQLNRAVLSISLNIAEGNGRWHKAERRNFFWIARGSCHECVPLLELCRRRGFITDQQHIELFVELETIAKMIAGLVKGIETN